MSSGVSINQPTNHSINQSINQSTVSAWPTSCPARLAIQKSTKYGITHTEKSTQSSSKLYVYQVILNVTPLICVRCQSEFGLVVTLTFDLWLWKSFQQFPLPLTWWIFVLSFIEILPLSTEISGHWNRYWQTTDGRTNRRTTGG